MLKWSSGVRAWRCESCQARQLSDRRPSGWSDREEREEPRPTSEPAKSAPARPKRRDPLAEKIAARRRRRTLLTALLVLMTGLAAGWLVIRSHTPNAAQISEID